MVPGLAPGLAPGADPGADPGAAPGDRALVEHAAASAPWGILIYDAGQRLVFANPQVRRIIGLPPETVLIGRSFAEMTRLSAFRGLHGPGDPELVTARILALDHAQPYQRTVRSQDGRWFDLSTQPLPDGGFACYCSDVTAFRRAEAEAMERTKLLEMALYHQQAGLALFDSGQRLLRHNPAYEQALGLMPGALHAGMTLDEVSLRFIEHYEGDASVRDLVQESRQLSRGQPLDETWALPDGRALRRTSQPMPNGGFLVTLHDVTALHQAEDAARHRAAALHDVLAALPYGVCVYDAGQRLTMVNTAYQDILRGAELRVGDHLLDICRRRAAAGEYPPGVSAEEVYHRQFDFGPPRQRVRADGTVIAVRTAPLAYGGHINVVADVTALHQAEARAQQRAGLLQAMLDNMRHGVCLFDGEGRVVALNALCRQRSGLPPEALHPGARLAELRALQFACGEFGQGPEAEAAYHARCAIDPRHRGRYTRTRADGTVIEVSTDPTPDGGFVRTYADITEERRIRAALETARQVAEQADLAKTRFLATMSHELRTPLNAVIGFSEALLAEPALPAQRIEFAGTILDAGRHLLSLIDDILLVAHLNGSEAPPQTRALHLPSVLGSTLRLVRKAAEDAGVDLVLEPLPEPLPRAVAEERRLRQVLLNLLSNAVKFTPPGGEVRLGVRLQADGALEITVRDTGIGIEPDDLPRAFEPFVQLETAHDRRYGGSGLGLYLARAFADAMGGTLVLESARGQGTLARLRLATAPHPPQEQP